MRDDEPRPVWMSLLITHCNKHPINACVCTCMYVCACVCTWVHVCERRKKCVRVRECTCANV